jgi:hypothetical protein
MSEHKYLKYSYRKFEQNGFVRDLVIDAFDAVGEHVAELEQRIDKLDKAKQGHSGRAR